MKEESNIFQSFPSTDKTQWEKLANTEIGEGKTTDSLQWSTQDGLTFKPIYSIEDTAAISYLDFFQLKSNGIAPNVRHWDTLPEVEVSDLKVANEIALHHLRNEAEGIMFNLNSAPVDYKTLLGGIECEHCNVSFRTFTESAFPDLLSFISEQRLDAAKLQGMLIWNDLNNLPQDLLKFKTSMRLLGIRTFEGTVVVQIAEALFHGVSVISKYQRLGWSASDVLGSIAFSLPVGPELLIESGKLKALRMLWYQVARSYDAAWYRPERLYIHAYSSVRKDEKYQPHGNMLSSTISAIGAICGGCNALTVSPEQIDSRMMGRVARNVSAVLREESHLGKVFDPFAGAYAADVITDEISKKAWSLFQKMVADQLV